MSTIEARIREALETHRDTSYETYPNAHNWDMEVRNRCSDCGGLDETPFSEHRASVLAEIIREAQAEAWDEGVMAQNSTGYWTQTLKRNPYRANLEP